jgi:NAD(P)-dependent dehydrogenase (short-subunit alcohol dehydrogenase family)
MARSILITGCSTGIGRCAAQGMKARGWRVFATARKPEDIASLEADGVTALFLDYVDEASIAGALDAVLVATDGRLDALFNNGAYAQPGALEDVRTDVLRAQFEANFFGWHELTRQVVPVMRRQRRGRIVMNSSVLGLIALGFRGPYNCTKFAIEAYSDTLRIELAGIGIHVSVIEPGPIRTNFTRTALGHARRNIDLETPSTGATTASAWPRWSMADHNRRAWAGGRAGRFVGGAAPWAKGPGARGRAAGGQYERGAWMGGGPQRGRQRRGEVRIGEGLREEGGGGE